VNPAAVGLEVVVLGGAAVDWVAEVETLPVKDGLALARSCTRFPGGSAANVAVGISRLGRRVGFVGKLGDDENGQLLLRAFEQERVDMQGIIIEAGRPTASCFVGVDRDGNRVIFVLPGASLIETTAELDLGHLPGRVLYIGPAYVEVATAAAATGRERGVTVFCAPGGGWGSDGLAQLHPVLEQVDVLLVSRSEAADLTGLTTPSEAIRRLGRMSPPVVIETLGAQGAMVLENERLTTVTAFAVAQVRDTTGAGDAFAAGLVVGFLEGLDWEAAAQLGCATAALKVRHVGARSGLPRREDVASFTGHTQPMSGRDI